MAKNKNKPGKEYSLPKDRIVDGYEVVVGNVDVFREILEKHKLEILEKHKLLQKLTEKSYEGTLTEDEQVKFDELWPYCSVDGCDNRINRNGNDYYCYPHLSQTIESGVN